MGRNRLMMIVDDDPRARAEVAALAKDAPVAVAAECGYGVEATGLAEDIRPEVVLLALKEPVDRAIRTLAALRSQLPDSQLLVYSNLTDLRVMRQVMQIGVADFLPLPLDQADLLAVLDPEEASAAAPSASATTGVVLTVFGAKGGIGKSTIATNLAALLATNTDLSVLIMDMDTRFGDIGIMMDIEARFTVSDLASSVDDLDRETFRGALVRHDCGAYVLAAPKHPSEWRNVSAEQMTQLIEYGTRLFDYVILDTPGTFNDIVATAIETATRVLVVTSLDMASIKDTAYMLDLLEVEGIDKERLLLVVNHVNALQAIKTEDIPRIVRHEVAWEIAYDDEVLRASHIGQPVTLAKPKSRAAKDLRGLAERIVGPAAFRQPERKRRRLGWLPFPRGGRLGRVAVATH